MHEAETFLRALAIVLCVAALTTALMQRLRQPVVLGYLFAGAIIGPHVPVPLVADPAVVHTLSEAGVILLLFSLGLEFSLRKLFRVGPAAGLTAIIQCSILFWLGYVVGVAFGWTTRESLYAGAVISVSSTTIIAKVFAEQRVGGRLRELVVGVLLVEDLIAILLMAGLTAFAGGSEPSLGALARSSGRLFAALAGFLVVGLLVVPRLMRAVGRLQRSEITLVTSIGVCFAGAVVALKLGYSVALGAFLVGSLVAESGEAHGVERLVEPVRDLFGAVFFVSVGMLFDPAVVLRHWPAVLVLTAVVVVGKLGAVALGAFLAGNGVRTSVQAGMSLAQIGEFSFIIAGLGVSLGAIGDFLYPVAVAVSALTTLFTPWLIRAAGPVAERLDRALPRPLQMFAALYGSWLERLRASPRRTTAASYRRLVRRLALDAVLLALVLLGGLVTYERAIDFAARRLRLEPWAARLLPWLVVGALAAPFVIGLFRVARRLGATLAEAALPAREEGHLDLAAAPRRALRVTLQLAVLLLVGLPLVAVTQPFLPGFQGALALVVLLLVFGVAFWRSATNLQGHVRAGAEVLAEALVTQARGGRPEAEADDPAFAQLFAGLGEPSPVRIEAGSPAVGHTLAELNLRGLTGATVLAIARGDEVVAPRAEQPLMAGDVVALAGTHEAVAAARALLAGRELPSMEQPGASP